MLEQGIAQLITSDATVSGLIGTRLYPVLLPTAPTFPCLTYQVVSASSDYSTDGSAETWKRIQFDAWSNSSYSDVKAIQKALHAVLDGFAGQFSDGTRVLGAFRGIELDEFESDSRTYRSLSEYSFHYVE